MHVLSATCCCVLCVFSIQNARIRRDKTLTEVDAVWLLYAYSECSVQDTVRNMRFSINFFTSIGLGGLTDNMREHLANMPKIIAAQQAAALAAARAEVLGRPDGLLRRSLI